MLANNISTPLEIIRGEVDDNLYHVFLIANPIIALVARMTIEAYKIPESKIICISIRNSDTSLVCDEFIALETLWHDRFFQNFFDKSTSGARLKKVINGKCDRYIVYTSWLYAEAESLLNCPHCIGHIYLEEGQLSYYDAMTFPVDRGYAFRYRQQQKSLGSVNYHYRDDALAFIGVLPDAYPSVPENKRIILQNYGDALKKYKPFLKGIFNIGVMPTPHRIPFSSLASAIQLLISKMPDGGAIKLHPGYKIYPKHTKRIVEIINESQCSNVTLCDDRAILELEMLVEPKELIGARSSLAKYAMSFGSRYMLVEFEGYTPPKN